MNVTHVEKHDLTSPLWPGFHHELNMMIMMLFCLLQCSPIQTTQRLRCEHTSYALGLTLPQSMHRIFFKTIGDTPANPKHAKKESLNNLSPMVSLLVCLCLILRAPSRGLVSLVSRLVSQLASQLVLQLVTQLVSHLVPHLARHLLLQLVSQFVSQLVYSLSPSLSSSLSPFLFPFVG